MSRSTEISKKLKEADPELSMYILELEKENLRLHKQVAKLQVMNLTKDNEIKALKKTQPQVKVVFKGFSSPENIKNDSSGSQAAPGNPIGCKTLLC